MKASTTVFAGSLGHTTVFVKAYTTVFVMQIALRLFLLATFPRFLLQLVRFAGRHLRGDSVYFSSGASVFLAGPAVQCGVQNGRIRFFCIFFLLNFFSPAGKLAASGKALRGVACRRHHCCSHLLFSRDTLKSCGRLHLSRGGNFLIRLRECSSSESLSVSPTNLESDEMGGRATRPQ